MRLSRQIWFELTDSANRVKVIPSVNRNRIYTLWRDSQTEKRKNIDNMAVSADIRSPHFQNRRSTDMDFAQPAEGAFQTDFAEKQK